MTRRVGAGRTALALVTMVACALGCREDPAVVELAQRVCEDVQAGRYEAALSASKGRSGVSGSARDVAECRCLAQISTRDAATCAAEIGPLFASREALDWTPHPMVAKVVLAAARAGRGDLEAAAALAERSAALHPADFDLLQLELDVRARVEESATLLAALEARLSSDAMSPTPGPSDLAQRLVLAFAWIDRGRPDATLRVLGDVAPPIEDRLALPWYEARIQAHARDGDLGGVQETFAAWRATGWDPVDLGARYALRLSTDHLTDPERSTLDLLRAAIARETELRDRNVAWALHRRLIVETLAAGRPEEALAAYDAAAGRVDLTGITRRELEQAVREERGESAPVERGTLRLVSPRGLRDGRWRISPGPDLAPDAGYREVAIAGRDAVVVEVTPGRHPVRWILESTSGAPLASGSVWPEPARRLDVVPDPASAAGGARSAPTLASAPPERGPADGRRRVFAILADCADWRVTEYLRARGELPFHDHLFARGRRAVLESRPAFTAAAMQALVSPVDANADAGAPSLRWMHQLGLELAGLEAVGRNPLSALAWLLPRRTGLFETLGAGPATTANMLLAHGDIEAGRHAEVIGPHGHRRALPTRHARRALAPAERARHPALLHDAETRRFAETIAAEMDAALEIARAGEIDFLFLRLEALDLMTHAHFAAIDGAGQDDGRGPLLAAYRYIDARLAALDAELDADDWLVYLSDHGIRSAMQHEEDAILAVLGPGVPPGRVPGQPHLAGVPRAFARMFDVDTAWPDTGAAPWLETLHADAPDLAARR